ncbi:DUF4097 family beta strand repeat-containing protein [Rhodococcus sp. SGAir0479]|uniref:DUF4097 family beta strand repeat-containing protein n=1 Tax=Rhodococcus sp. SGAir0479 TaxID=2567884 RepID=UPI0010CD0C59|nr:DUF4097 family beta strand repeat-containing protein [Rhodococcus sp. SGAir0479]QCQ90037.1 hypothetical protein E7742_01640 [Rhodococcus sp. SGAir0479]
MPTFSTDEPISATLSFPVGDVTVTATDRNDTVVEVHPSDPQRDVDVRAAEQTRVEYSGGRLLVQAPRPRGLGVWGKVGSIDVTVALPSGSSLEADASAGAVRSTGRLGNVRVKTATGDVRLGSTAPATVTTGAGAVVVDTIAGDAELSTGSGTVEVRRVDGNATVKNSNGHNRIGSVRGNLRIKTANGDIAVGHTGGDVHAATANGEIRIDELTRGTASLRTGHGAIEVGIPAGTAARLDVHTSFGKVHNLLTPTDRPAPIGEKVDVEAHTGFGDITVQRAGLGDDDPRKAEQ